MNYTNCTFSWSSLDLLIGNIPHHCFGLAPSKCSWLGRSKKLFSLLVLCGALVLSKWLQKTMKKFKCTCLAFVSGHKLRNHCAAVIIFVKSRQCERAPYCKCACQCPWLRWLGFDGLVRSTFLGGIANMCKRLFVWYRHIVARLYTNCFATSTAGTQGIGQRGKKLAYLTQRKADWGQTCPSLAKGWAEHEPTCAQLGPVGSNLGPSCGHVWAQLGLRLGPVWVHLAPKLSPNQAQCGEHGVARATIKAKNHWK